MQPNPVLSRRLVRTTGLLLAWCAVGANAGNLDAPAAPTSNVSAMYSLTDLYNRLHDGTAGSKRSGVFVEPAAGPTTGTGYTLDQIMEKMPAMDAVGATAAEVLAGKTFWGLSSGAWGMQTGTYVGSSAPFPVAKTGDVTENSNHPTGATWPNPRFTDNNNNGTVTDNLTGLVWLKNAGCGGTKNWIAAMNWVLTLKGDNTMCSLNDGSVAGQWRLPNIKELSSLVNAGALSPALPTGHPFTGVQSGNYYWSSTPYAGGTSFAWYVNLLDGYVNAYGKTSNNAVWPVRGGL